ncbi:MAG: hypothetical protein A3J93_01545 [Candidatus Magasanikbacteria bacterium RIFOXYC2_FULL_42_28]|uniref:UMP kinase n=1 Tax=Candidatus Magasanikbacteria bacterium RIFOXYC2_FULL_42_28 TaxID=1798704 RepID=A0A1F6NXU5_9BACT|nr:MAG: hypothetical protein A3J93_01545 [Candidatus Magasanikbacteria bacterium RIFOXYC2_FULL_42_28]
MASKSEIVVLSLGGSLIAPAGGVDAIFIKKFLGMIFKLIKNGYRFIIVCGGGTTARAYQNAGQRAVGLSGTAMDWVGIYATWLNANFMKVIFGSLAYPEIIVDPTKKIKWNKPILMAGGWKPGRSTDDDAVRLAENFGADTVINLSNVDYVYDRDPELPGAKKIETMNWKDLQKIVGTTWSPGAHVPFDPIATKLGTRLGITLKFVKGTDLASARQAIKNEKFKGTIVE